MQVEVPLAIDQFGGAEFALAKLFAHPGRHLQPPGNVALLACYAPARRAAKVDPMVALREE